VLFGTFLTIHVVVIAVAAGLLTATAFALALILLAGLTSLATLVLLTRLLMRGLITALLHVLGLLGVVWHLTLLGWNYHRYGRARDAEQM
jgi:hypothetical protein